MAAAAVKEESVGEEQTKNNSVDNSNSEPPLSETVTLEEMNDATSAGEQTPKQDKITKKRQRGKKKGSNVAASGTNDTNSSKTLNQDTSLAKKTDKGSAGAPNTSMVNNSNLQHPQAEPANENDQHTEAQKEGVQKDEIMQNDRERKSSSKKRRKKKKQVGTKDSNKPTLPSGSKESKDKIAGLIFMCNDQTKQECFRHRIFGLPANKKETVAKAYKGMKLFLFDVNLRLLYGIYKAARPGGYDIKPNAFGSAFPSQVRFKVVADCVPLPEEKFKVAIKDNYFTKMKFACELTIKQVKDLCKLFWLASDAAGQGRGVPQKQTGIARTVAPSLRGVEGRASRQAGVYEGEGYPHPSMPLPRPSSPVPYAPYRRPVVDYYDGDLQLHREQRLRALGDPRLEGLRRDPYHESCDDRLLGTRAELHDPIGARRSQLGPREVRLLELERERQMLLHGRQTDLQSDARDYGLRESWRDRELLPQSSQMAGLGRDLPSDYSHAVGGYRQESYGLAARRENLMPADLQAGYRFPVGRY